jgi:hypothetical protein
MIIDGTDIRILLAAIATRGVYSIAIVLVFGNHGYRKISLKAMSVLSVTEMEPPV